MFKIRERTSHKEDTIDTHHPVQFHHLLGLLEEHLRLCGRIQPTGPLGSLGAQKHLTLRQHGPHTSCEQGNTGSCPEKTAPASCNHRYKLQVDASGEEVAYGVPLLENTASNTTGFDGKILKGSGCGEAPNTTHANTKEGADCEELAESLDEASTELENGDEEEVSYKRPSSAETVGNNSKYQLGEHNSMFVRYEQEFDPEMNILLQLVGKVMSAL